jgi:hypothetical protein
MLRWAWHLPIASIKIMMKGLDEDSEKGLNRDPKGALDKDGDKYTDSLNLLVCCCTYIL